MSEPDGSAAGLVAVPGAAEALELGAADASAAAPVADGLEAAAPPDADADADAEPAGDGAADDPGAASRSVRQPESPDTRW
jgi:hypothetical protein